MIKWCTCIVFSFLLCKGTNLFAQPSVAFDTARKHILTIIQQLPDSSEIKIGAVTIIGHKRTKDYIVYREIQFKAGSKFYKSQLLAEIEQARLNVMNTQLFLEVIPGIEIAGDGLIHVLFTLKERWYIFPAANFKFIDRNLNQWWYEQNRSLERINYGVKFHWDNVSGRRDKLSFTFNNGYSRKYELFYEQPFADRKLETGFLAGIFYTQTRQINYATNNSNKQVFYPLSDRLTKDFVRTTFRAETGVTIRKGVKHRHTFRLNYVDEKIDDAVNQIILDSLVKGYRPYFTNFASRQKFGELSYSYQFFNVNNIAYPWNGLAVSCGLFQRGLGAKGMNLWQASVKTGKFFEIKKKTSISLIGHSMIKLPFQQPVYNMSALGYGDWFLQGLEDYVIDGVLAGILKASVRQEVLNINVPTFLIKNEKYKKIPFKFIVKTYGNIGGSYLPYFTDNLLNNKLLYTGGFGLDVLSYYDFVAKIEYSFNQLGQKGLFLHLRKEF
jgi:outer membrane protein assembly factor BamA